MEQRRKRMHLKYPARFFKLIIFLDFIYKRAFPKLPILKKLYFVISRGENRVISKCETLGRLYFCGFKLIKMQEIGNKRYFIVNKVNTPLKDESPSYGPIFN